MVCFSDAAVSDAADGCDGMYVMRIGMDGRCMYGMLGVRSWFCAYELPSIS